MREIIKSSMAYLIAKWLVGALSVLIVAEFLGGFSVSGIYIALIAAFMWGLLSVFIRPLILLITLPINILTFGLFTFLINGALLLFLSTFLNGFEISGFWLATFAAILISIVNWAGNQLIGKISGTDDNVKSYQQ